MRLGCALMLAAWLMPAQAASIDSLDITHSGSRYRMQLAATLDAPMERSFAVFEQFANLPKINDAIESAESLPAPSSDVRRLKTRVRVCVWYFCVRLNQVQDIRTSRGDGLSQMDADVIAALSNLRYGRAQWQMRSCAAQTCLLFDAEVEPDFWVPPVIGPWAIARAMRREAVTTANGIERLALTTP